MWPFSFVNCHDRVGKEGNCGNHPFSLFTPCPLFLNSFAQDHERTQVPPRRILLPSRHKFLLPPIMDTWSRPTCRCLRLLRGPNVAPYGASWKTFMFINMSFSFLQVAKQYWLGLKRNLEAIPNILGAKWRVNYFKNSKINTSVHVRQWLNCRWDFITIWERTILCWTSFVSFPRPSKFPYLYLDSRAQ